MWNPFKKKAINLAEGEGERSVYESVEEATYHDPAAADAVSFDEPRPEYGEEEMLTYKHIDISPDLEALREHNIVEDLFTYRLKQTVRGLVLVLVALLPIFFQTLTAPGDVLTVSKQGLVYFAALLGLALWLVIVVRQGGAVLKHSGLELGIGVWLAAALAAAVFSPQLGRSFIAPNGFIITGALAVLFFLLVNFFEAGDIGRLINYWLLGTLLAVGSGLLALWNVPVFGWVSWLVGKSFQVSAQFNTVGSYNVMGALAALGIVLAAGQWFRIGGRDPEFKSLNVSNFWQIAKIGAAIVSAILLLMIGYWGFYLAVAVGMLAIVLAPGLLQRLTGNPVKVRAAAITGPLVVLVLALLLALGTRFGFNVPGSLGTGTLPPEVRLGYRPSLTVAAGAVGSRPVFGWGPGNYYLAYQQYKPAALNNTVFWNSTFGEGTAEVLTLVVNYGLIGLAGFIALAALVLRAVWRRSRSAGAPDIETFKPLNLSSLWSILPAFLAVLALTLVFPFSNIVLLFAFWLSLGLLGIATARPDDEWRIMVNNPSLAAVSASLGFILALAGGLAGAYFIGQRLSDEYAYARVLRADVSDPARADQTAAALARLTNSPAADLRYLTLLGQLFLGRINAELNNKKDKPADVQVRVQQLANNAVQVAQVISGQYPRDSDSWTVAGQIYQSLIPLYRGADAAAVNAYQQALQRSPRDPGLYVSIGNVYLGRAEQNSAALADARRRNVQVQNESDVSKLIAADYKQAEDNFKKAVGLKSDLGTALYALGVVYERENRLKDAIKQLQSAAAGDFRNPGLAFELGLLYYRDNQKPQAFNEMSRAVDLLPNYANARWYRALMLEEVGRVDDAIAELNAILKVKENADNQTVKDKLAALEAGKREIPPAKVTSRKPL